MHIVKPETRFAGHKTGSVFDRYNIVSSDDLRSAATKLQRLTGTAQMADRIWVVTFMDCDLGYFDDETCRLEPIANPFGPKVLPMCPE